MSTTTERLGRTRVRVSPGSDGQRCLVRTSVTGSDPTVPTIRPVVTRHDPHAVRLCLVQEGALLLAGDAVEVDLTVDPGATVEVVEPGGTVAYDMRGASARWDVRLHVGEGAALAWAGQPFVVSSGADVRRRTQVRCAPGSRLALRETLVLGRSGESPGVVRQEALVRAGTRPVLAEELTLDAGTARALLGGNRVVSTVLLVGAAGPSGSDFAPGATRGPLADRYDLAGEQAVLWRRLGAQAHHASVAEAWAFARGVTLRCPSPVHS